MSNKERLSKRQLQAMETRDSLLNAGRIVFLENGFQKATMAQINKVANTGYGTAYVYFKNKDELFIELIEKVMKKMYEVAALPYKPKTKQECYILIEKSVRLFIQSSLEEKKVMKIIKEAIGVSTIVEEKWNAIQKHFIKEITEDIQYVQKIGLARDDVQADLIARGWFYMNEQFMWDLVSEKIDEELDIVYEHLVKLYTSGLYK